MRRINSFIVVSSFLCVIDAKAYDYQALRSKPSGDLMVEIWLHKGPDKAYSFSAPIRYEFLTVTNRNCVVELPKDEYVCSLQMLDSGGKSVPLSAKCSMLGKQFHNLKYPSVEQPWSEALGDVLRMKPAHSTGPSEPRSDSGPPMEADFVIATQDGSSQMSLPSVEDLFAVEIPGEYKVRLQFQVYARIYKGGQTFTYKLERFEPVEFTVTKKRSQ